MSSATLIVGLSTFAHELLGKSQPEDFPLWHKLHEHSFPQYSYNPERGDYLVVFGVNSRFDHDEFFSDAIGFFKESLDEAHEDYDIVNSHEVNDFMGDHFGVHLLTDYGDYTSYEGNFDMSLSFYLPMNSIDVQGEKLNIKDIDELFVQKHGFGSMTLGGAKHLIDWIREGESLESCFDELVYRCMCNELANLKPSERKKHYPSEVLEVSEKAFKGSVKRLQREFKKEAGQELKPGKANQMLARIVYDKSAPEAKAIIKAQQQSEPSTKQTLARLNETYLGAGVIVPELYEDQNQYEFSGEIHSFRVVDGEIQITVRDMEDNYFSYSFDEDVVKDWIKDHG